MAKYQDIKITDSFDLALDSAGMPVFVYDRDVIAQDIRHVILESGLLFDLIGEIRAQHRELVFTSLKILIERDERVNPGSTDINELTNGNLLIQADTEFGPLTLRVNP